jgi:hypothetical protein
MDDFSVGEARAAAGQDPSGAPLLDDETGKSSVGMLGEFLGDRSRRRATHLAAFAA